MTQKETQVPDSQAADKQTIRSATGARRIRDYYLAHRLCAGLGLICLLATNGLALIIPSLLGHAVDLVKDGQATELVAKTAGLVAAVAGLAALARIGSRGFLFYAGRVAEHDLRLELFAHLSLLAPSYYRKNAVGDLVSRVTNDLNNVRALMGFGILTIVNFSLVYLGNLPLVFVLDVPLALVALAPLPALILLTRYGARLIFVRSVRVQDVLGQLSSRITENLAGISVVRSFGREDAEIADFDVLNQEYYRASMRLVMVRNVLWPLAGALFGAGSLAVLWYGGLRVMDGAMTVGEFVEFNTRLAILAWPTLAIGWVAGMWQRGKASMQRINEVFSTEPTIKDHPQAVDIQVKGALRANDLSVTYHGAEHPALRDVSFSVPAGGVLGVVGKTGSGKSTLARALVRLVELPPQQLFVDDHDITKIRITSLRGAVGYADQDSFLFSASLKENICFVRPQASTEELNSVVDISHLTPDLKALPNGLETLVGERGVTLSGGQRQRAVLARALLAQPRLLILDDCLAAVDTETEAAILGRLSEVVHNQTTVIVSHRLSAVRAADEIVVLDKGVVVERGKHDQLLASKGLYWDMWNEQAVEQELEQEIGS